MSEADEKPSVFDKLRALDAYPKTLDDFRVRTAQGAVVSLVAIVLMVILFFSELSFFMTAVHADSLAVDNGHKEKLSISFDVTFPSTPCASISVSAMDPSGEHELSTDHEVYKKRLDKSGNGVAAAEKNNMGGTVKTKEDLHVAKDVHDGGGDGGEKKEKPCLSCYGAAPKGECCNTCDEVKQAYAKKGWKLPVLNMRNHITQCANEGFEASLQQKDEGCNLYGSFNVPKVAGNFHFGPSKSFQHAHLYTFDLMSYTTEGFNISHTINKISFGPAFPDRDNPLDGARRMLAQDQGTGMFQYYCQVVPTQYTGLGGSTIQSNQYAVTEHFRKIRPQSQRWLPGVFFFYDISPIKVNREEQRRGFLQFLTSVCAIIGGIFTVMGMVDSSLHSLRKKGAGAGLG
jgi:hypothetical protein